MYPPPRDAGLERINRLMNLNNSTSAPYNRAFPYYRSDRARPALVGGGNGAPYRLTGRLRWT